MVEEEARKPPGKNHRPTRSYWQAFSDTHMSRILNRNIRRQRRHGSSSVKESALDHSVTRGPHRLETIIKDMSWKDIFRFSRKKKEEEIAGMRGKLFVLVDNCFLTTNKIIDCIQKYIPIRKFDKLELDTYKSIGHNCDLIIQRLRELDKYLEETKVNLEKQMNPEIFRKLVSPDTSFMEKIKIAKLSSTTIIGIAGSVEGIVLCGEINAGNVFVNITRVLCVMKSSAIADISVQVLSGGLNKTTSVMIYPYNYYDLAVSGGVLFGAILALSVFASVTRVVGDLKTHAVATSFFGVLVVGFYMLVSSTIKRTAERDQLEKVLNDYQRVVQEIQPAIDAFYDHISLVRAKTELTV